VVLCRKLGIPGFVYASAGSKTAASFDVSLGAGAVFLPLYAKSIAKFFFFFFLSLFIRKRE